MIVARWQQGTFDPNGFQYFIYRIIFNLDSCPHAPRLNDTVYNNVDNIVGAI